jgi:hypothetical protein
LPRTSLLVLASARRLTVEATYAGSATAAADERIVMAAQIKSRDAVMASSGSNVASPI